MALANAYTLAKIECDDIPENFSYGDPDVLEDIEEDFQEFGYQQPVRLYRKYLNLYLVFYDYDIINVDELRDEPYIEVPLGKARAILKEQSRLID